MGRNLNLAVATSRASMLVRAVLTGAIVAVTLVAVAAGGSSATKQRIAIDGKFTIATESSLSLPRVGRSRSSP